MVTHLDKQEAAADEHPIQNLPPRGLQLTGNIVGDPWPRLDQQEAEQALGGGSTIILIFLVPSC